MFLTALGVYSAAAYGRDLVKAGLIAGLGVLVHDLLDPLITGFGDAIWSSSLVVLAFGAGLTGRTLVERTRRLDDRTAALERDEEELAEAAAADERSRIARELHDIISHSLGVVVLQAGAAERVLEQDPARAKVVLASIRETGREAINEMGTLLGLMDQVPLSSREPQPSLANVEGLVMRMRDAGLDVRLVVEGSRRDVPAPVDVSAFRVVQEGLTNVLKHAGSTRVCVTLRYGPESLVVEVADDGGSAQGAGGRRGLAGLQERVAVFGGSLHAGRRPGGGWTLTAIFPLVGR